MGAMPIPMWSKGSQFGAAVGAWGSNFASPKPAAAPAATGTGGGGNGNGSGLPAPNDGSYNNILTNLQAQNAAGAAEAAYWKQKQIDDAAAYAKQIEAIQISADQNAASLRDMMIKQQSGFDQQLALQQQQLLSSQAAYQEQVRQVGALSRAYIPTAQPTAAAPLSGDNRTANLPASSSGGNSSTLSSLSILSGLGSTAPTLAGLQIA